MIVVTTDDITIEGSGPGVTILQPTIGGTPIAFRPQTNDLTFKDMTIEDGGQGIRFELAGGTIDNTEVNNVEFLNNSSRGIELHNATTVTDLRVIDSVFQGNGGGVGIRMASTSTVDGLTITDSTFDSYSLGVYQANDGGTSTLNDLHISGSTFTNHSDTAVFAEEITNSLIEDSSFEDNRRDFSLFKAYGGAGAEVKNLTIRGNTFVNSRDASVQIYACTTWPSPPL